MEGIVSDANGPLSAKAGEVSASASPAEDHFGGEKAV
jgi:hypothetical protein